MERIKRLLSKSQRRNKPQVATSAPKPFTAAEREKFAKAVVRDFGETLVLLGKE